MKNNEVSNPDKTLTFDISSLPELSEEDRAYAQGSEQLDFIRGFMLDASIGKYHWFGHMGFSLQYAGDGEFRCIFLVNHPEIEYCMALVNHSIERVGGHIVLEPYTIVVPFVEDHVEDDEERNQPPVKQEHYGMEVA